MITHPQNHAVQQQQEDAKADGEVPLGLGRRFRSFMCGWGALVTAGIMSITFLLCIAFVPSTNIFPIYRDPYAGMVPLIKQGYVRLYPPFQDRRTTTWENDTYFIALPPNDLAGITESLNNIIKNYPQEETNVYRQCWLQNPTYEHPCFFNIEWLGSACVESNDFGYREVNGTFNPCLILRIEDTGQWQPVPSIHGSRNSKTGSDAEFVRVNCGVKFASDVWKFKSIRVTPQKGFSRLYFPISNFDPKLYLFPIVAVQVRGLVKGESVTVVCQIDAQNAFFLEDDGLVTFQLSS